MKKPTASLLALSLAMLSACNFQTQPISVEVTPTTSTTSAATITTKTAPPTTTRDPNIPEYVPGSIKLMPDGYWEDQYELPYVMKYRLCYYTLPGWVEFIGASIDPNAWDWATDEIAENRDSAGPSEMPLVAYVKHFNIPKEDFVKGVEKDTLSAQRRNQDMTEEEFEEPNADIIYTFDNEIINDYYRRE